MSGEGTKTLDEEMVRQLRQNNLGPAEMLLPLTSVERREEYAESIDKKMTPKLEISGGGSIFDLWLLRIILGDSISLMQKKRYEAFFVYNKATVQGDLQKDLPKKVPIPMCETLLRGNTKGGSAREFLESFAC